MKSRTGFGDTHIGDNDPCLCGCGGVTAKGRLFRMGHDQRFRGELMRAHLEGRGIPSLDGSTTFPAMVSAESLGPTWVESLRKAEAKKQMAIAKVDARAKRDKRPHKIGKNEKAKWAICCVYDLKNGGQEIDYVDQLGHKGRIVVPPKEDV